MSGSRKEVLSDALKAEVGAASVDLKTLFTDDVTGWSPYVTVADFREGKIRSFRTYFDDLSLIEQIVGA